MPILSTLSLAATLTTGLAGAGAVHAEALPVEAAAAPMAVHHGPEHRRGPHAAKRLERMCRIAQCTDAQREKIRTIFEKGRDATKAERKRLRTLHEKMRAEWTKETLDRKAILRLHDEISKAKAKLARERLERRMEVFAVLSPEQRARLAEHRAKMRGKKHGRKHGRKHGKR